MCWAPSFIDNVYQPDSGRSQKDVLGRGIAPRHDHASRTGWDERGQILPGSAANVRNGRCQCRRRVDGRQRCREQSCSVGVDSWTVSRRWATRSSDRPCWPPATSRLPYESRAVIVIDDVVADAAINVVIMGPEAVVIVRFRAPCVTAFAVRCDQCRPKEPKDVATPHPSRATKLHDASSRALTRARSILSPNRTTRTA